MAKSELMTKIYSQASNDVVIPTYLKKEDGESGPNSIKDAIIVRGGANVAFSASNKHKRNTKWAVTEVSAEELKTLESNPAFMRKVKRGFISIGKEPEEVKADKSAQLTESQMKSKAPNSTVSTGKVEK